MLAVPLIVRSNQYFWRIDHNFGPKDKVFVRWLGDRQVSPQPTTNPHFVKTYKMNPSTWAGQWIHIVSARILNEVRVRLVSFSGNGSKPTEQHRFRSGLAGDR